MTRGRLMTLTNKCAAAAVLLTVAVVQPCKTFGQSAHDAIGTWVFVSSINEQNGRKTETYGPGASGVMVLDSTGRYSIAIIAAGLPKFVSDSRTTATADEAKAVVARSNAHFGLYSVNPEDKTITFQHREGYVSELERDRRSITIKGDELQYAVTASSAGGSSIVTWKRAK